MVQTLVTVIAYNVILLYMFVSRILYLDRQSDSAIYEPVIEKSTVLCISGIVSSLLMFVIWLISGFPVVAFVDQFFNTVLLNCMFNFGDSLYHNLINRCDGCADRCRQQMGLRPPYHLRRNFRPRLTVGHCPSPPAPDFLDLPFLKEL